MLSVRFDCLYLPSLKLQVILVFFVLSIHLAIEYMIIQVQFTTEKVQTFNKFRINCMIYLSIYFYYNKVLM